MAKLARAEGAARLGIPLEDAQSAGASRLQEALGYRNIDSHEVVSGSQGEELSDGGRLECQLHCNCMEAWEDCSDSWPSTAVNRDQAATCRFSAFFWAS